MVTDLDKIKTNFCPMCGEQFDICNCGQLAFSIKWLRDRINQIKDS